MLDDSTSFRGGIYDISKITYIHQDARAYLAEGQNVKGKVVGVALLSSTFLGKTIGNLLISLGSPKKFPVKYFDSPIRAEHWVRTKMLEAKELEQKKVAA